MSDVENAAPSGAGDGAVQSVETTPAQVSEQPSGSAREALEKAFSAESPTPDKGKTEPATTPDKPGPKIDALGRAHRPDGTVAKKGEFDLSEKPAEPVEKPKRPPPARFAKEVHPHWESAHEALQAEIDRALTEQNSGIEKHRTEAERLRAEYEPLRPFAEMARQSGTTLERAVSNYVGIERLIRANPVAGIAEVCKNIGIHPVQMAQVILQIAQGQRPMPQTRPQPLPQPQRPPDVRALVQEELQAVSLKQEIERMEAEKPFFELLRPSMAQIVQAGEAHTVADAYEAALSKRPELKEAIEAKAAAEAAKAEVEKLKGGQRPTADQTREKANLSVTGSPSVGSYPSQGKAAGSAREALERAAASVGL